MGLNRGGTFGCGCGKSAQTLSKLKARQETALAAGPVLPWEEAVVSYSRINSR